MKTWDFSDTYSLVHDLYFRWGVCRINMNEMIESLAAVAKHSFDLCADVMKEKALTGNILKQNRKDSGISSTVSTKFYVLVISCI